MVRVGVVGCGVGVRGGGSGVVKLDAGAGGTSGDRDLAEAFLGLTQNLLPNKPLLLQLKAKSIQTPQQYNSLIRTNSRKINRPLFINQRKARERLRSVAFTSEDEGAGLGGRGRVDGPTVTDRETVDEVETGELF